MDHQQTLKKEVAFSGKGLFTGQETRVRLSPAPPGSGILFRRSDLTNSPLIPASVEFVKSSVRCTLLEKEGASVQTVEHLLAALRGYEIDNLFIEVSAPEVPIFDGSAAAFCQKIEEAGIQTQAAEKQRFKLEAPLYWSEGEMHLIALPSNEYRISYTLHYPHSPYLKSQFFSLALTPQSFQQEIASCRTFTLYEDIAPLIEKGILKGGGLENGVVIKEGAVMNPEGVRFSDEMVRHKILDVIGDLALVGAPFLAHIIAIRSGHAANQALAHQIANHIRKR